MSETEIQASLTAFGHSLSRVTAVVIEQTPAQRLGRTLAGLGMFWAGRFVTGRSVECPKCHGILTLVAGEAAA